MHLFTAVKNVLQQLIAVLDQLTAEQYQTASAYLSGSTIGQHTRHVIELYQCLLNGYDRQYVCYDDRKRDVRIETDLLFAKELLQQIASAVSKENIDLQLAGTYDKTSNEQIHITTNYYRELLYNHEHTIHHMALIRVGLKEVSAAVIEADFGIASSTIRNKQQCAQ
ncbi:DinB family protein [Lacibacter luteus]|uniref:DinB family protein n=1 Tax=Lacibacter luteus TaxID=2508719 RepID=A0A4V1M747_9BACT|nr:DinB family protein [Lacibacter luteus]RXK58280.1 DinB family protein [Lacibacter luteus]